LQHAGGLDAGVGHDQRARDADAFAFLLEQFRTAPKSNWIWVT
jgi:hypothetical protein